MKQGIKVKVKRGDLSKGSALKLIQRWLKCEPWNHEKLTCLMRWVQKR